MVELRQWCPKCQAATVTWVDSRGVAHCQGCDTDPQEEL